MANNSLKEKKSVFLLQFSLFRSPFLFSLVPFFSLSPLLLLILIFPFNISFFLFKLKILHVDLFILYWKVGFLQLSRLTRLVRWLPKWLASRSSILCVGQLSRLSIDTRFFLWKLKFTYAFKYIFFIILCNINTNLKGITKF